MRIRLLWLLVGILSGLLLEMKAPDLTVLAMVTAIGGLAVVVTSHPRSGRNRLRRTRRA